MVHEDLVLGAGKQTFTSSFAYLGLRLTLLMKSQIFLHRDFIPLLPLRLLGPSGPTEPPFFSSEAPPGWWESSAETLHHAADCVADILAQLQTTKTLVMSPLVGFCAFSTALIHLHTAAFPQMNSGGSSGSVERAETCIAYLSDFGKLWKIGQDWVRNRPGKADYNVVRTVLTKNGI